jgi:hypothetical protein
MDSLVIEDPLAELFSTSKEVGLVLCGIVNVLCFYSEW